MTHGWRGRIGRLLQAGIGAALLVGPIGCFSADKPKKEGSRALPLPSNLPPPNLPIPSVNPSVNSAAPVQPAVRSAPPAPVTPLSSSSNPVHADPSMQRPNLYGGTIQAPTIPGANAATMPLSPAPGASSRSVATASVISAPIGEASPPPLQGTPPGIKHLIPSGEMQPPVAPPPPVFAGVPVPKQSITSAPPLPLGNVPELVPPAASSVPSSGGLVLPASLGPAN